MTQLTVVDNEFITVWYYTDTHIIHHRIKPLKHPYNKNDRALFRHALEKGVDMMKTHNANKWLSDDRGAGALPTEDVEWGQKYWAPKAVVAGWKYWAIVVPDEEVAQMSWSTIIRKFSELGVTVSVFGSSDEAITWLESKLSYPSPPF